MQPSHILQLLVLLTLANGTPIVAKKILGARFARPLDAGILLFDRRPVFGHSKTIRGILTSIFMTTMGSLLMGMGMTIGAIVASTAMAGDLFSSSSSAAWIFRQVAARWGLIRCPNPSFRCWHAATRFH